LVCISDPIPKSREVRKVPILLQKSAAGDGRSAISLESAQF
jgi:hypothetical protein